MLRSLVQRPTFEDEDDDENEYEEYWEEQPLC
jgi:hypothetical protein